MRIGMCRRMWGICRCRRGVVELTGGARVAELSRMLAGLEDTETGRAHAQELLDKAQAEVADFR